MTTHRTLLALVPFALALFGCGPAADDGELAATGVGAVGEGTFAVDISLWSGEITDAEVRCWWDQGVRHVVVGAQNHRISRQQLAKAQAGGMTIDLYEYLTWDVSTAAQVTDALTLAAEFPAVTRLWIDVEEEPGGLGKAALTTRVNDALAACGDFPCGIYTGNWWWQPHMQGSTAFASVPLWYAFYDLDPSMATWSSQQFGGWAAPTAKQWQETYFCGIDVDKDTMVVEAEPPPPPAPLPPDVPGPPAAPTGMYPSGMLQIETASVRVLVDTVPGASSYQFEIQSWNGSAYQPYFTYTTTTNARRFNPVYPNRVYRWRARAKDADGWGVWSGWATYELGKAKSFPPDAQPAPDPDPDPDPQPQPVPGAPTGLAPPDGSAFAAGSVTLSCSAVSGADGYAFQIETKNPATQQWATYFTYTGASPSRTFWPQTKSVDYRWRVRAKAAGQWTPDSAWSGFHYGN